MGKLDVYNLVAVSSGAVVGFMWGGWSVLLQILVFVVVIDYISGMIAAGIEGKLKSTVGFKGIAKKVMLFLMVAIGHQIDLALGDSHVFRDATIFFYLGNELLSILENAGRIGLPVPEPLRRAVDILKSKGETK
jgi:toxin secretion/phage lysis holin